MSKASYGFLIIHGFASSLDSVRGVEASLSALKLPIRMPLLRGHGADSPEALRHVTWHEWLADAASALQELLAQAENVMIIGHSMGGLVALNLAMTHGERVDSIVLAAAAIQITSPLSPGKPLYFLAPLMPKILKNLDSQLKYTDPSLANNDTSYHWFPSDATLSFLNFARVTRDSLSSVKTPALILQSRKDTTVDPKSAEIIYNGITTPAVQKRIVWFEKTNHEMFQDCERAAIFDVITKYVQERMSAR